MLPASHFGVALVKTENANIHRKQRKCIENTQQENNTMDDWLPKLPLARRPSSLGEGQADDEEQHEQNQHEALIRDRNLYMSTTRYLQYLIQTGIL